MNKIDLDRIKNDYQGAKKHVSKRVVLCAGTGCVANGSIKVYDALVKAIKKAGTRCYSNHGKGRKLRYLRFKKRLPRILPDGTTSHNISR